MGNYKRDEEDILVMDLAKQYEHSSLTICTILKQKDSIMCVTAAKGVTILKLRTSVHEKMENLLFLWIKEKQLTGDTLTICEMA